MHEVWQFNIEEKKKVAYLQSILINF